MRSAELSGGCPRRLRVIVLPSYALSMALLPWGERPLHQTENAPLPAPLTLDVGAKLDVGARAAALGRRLLDVVMALVLIVITLPVMIVVAAAVLIDSGWPMLYQARRQGQGGRPFRLLKFRSMWRNSERQLGELLELDELFRIQYDSTHKILRDPRCTRIGQVLRRSSLDELPQLFNVLAGHMSLIGPRPYSFLELDGRVEARELLSVPPGMTGLWQVSGRSHIDFERRIVLELAYVRTRSWRLDLAIAARTLAAVVTRRGAY